MIYRDVRKQLKSLIMMSKIVKMLIKKTIFMALLFLCCAPSAFSQSVLNSLAGNTNFPIKERLSKEKILSISPTRRVYIVSRSDQNFSSGDYVTIIVNDQHVLRAIVAKTTNSGKAGIKSIKIYNPEITNLLRVGLEVQILKGDDSFYVNRPSKQAGLDKENSEVARISSEDDLYNDTTFLEEDLKDEDSRNKRKLPTDNIVSAHIGFIRTLDLNSATTSDTHFGMSYQYQFSRDIWGEFSYGYSSLAGFPDPNLSTTLQTYTFKAKYTFATPFYSYVQPYIGYRVMSANAPEYQTGDTIDQETQNALVDDLEKSGVIGGLTVLKRLVPGWFLRADLGLDILGFGLAVEF